MAQLGEAYPQDRPLLLESDPRRKERILQPVVDRILPEDPTGIKIKQVTNVKVSATYMIRTMIQETLGPHTMSGHNLQVRKCQISICWSKTLKTSNDNNRSRSILSLEYRQLASKVKSNLYNLSQT
jgi:hypothetical protein